MLLAQWKLMIVQSYHLCKEHIFSIYSPARIGNISSFFFPTILLRANYFPSPVQHSIRLHVRWLWLMVVILFGRNVALLGNWRWVQGWEKAFLNLMLLRQIEPLCSFFSHILTACLHSLYSSLLVSQTYFLLTEEPAYQTFSAVSWLSLL